MWKAEDVSLEAGLFLYLVSPRDLNTGQVPLPAELSHRPCFVCEGNVKLLIFLSPPLKLGDHIAAFYGIMGIKSWALFIPGKHTLPPELVLLWIKNLSQIKTALRRELAWQ